MLEVLSIEHRGDYDCEHVALKAVEDGGISGWNLGRSAVSPSVVTFLFSFPDMYVSNGDLIYATRRSGLQTCRRRASQCIRPRQLGNA
jgi:hypothetical protein